ncbi:Uncharacterised protein [uncultured archaeon]|nr:Uncharacterised protein [uncultured archaeon]
MPSKRHKIVKRFVDRKLRMRMALFAIIILALLVLITYDIFMGAINAPLALAGILIGILVGFFAGRMFNITWHEESNKVVSRMDWIGIIVLVIYMIFAIFRTQIFSAWVSGPAAGAFGFCVIAGTLIGRFWSMRRKTIRILRKRGLVKRR